MKASCSFEGCWDKLELKNVELCIFQKCRIIFSRLSVLNASCSFEGRWDKVENKKCRIVYFSKMSNYLFEVICFHSFLIV